MLEDKGCIFALKEFIDYLFEREKENFRAWRKDNQNSVTLTTIHQVTILLDLYLMEFSSTTWLVFNRDKLNSNANSYSFDL
jgi:hypothetical protein